MIDHCDKNNYKLVVVTHYCPSYTITNNCKKRKQRIQIRMRFYTTHSTNKVHVAQPAQHTV